MEHKLFVKMTCWSKQSVILHVKRSTRSKLIVHHLLEWWKLLLLRYQPMKFQVSEWNCQEERRYLMNGISSISPLLGRICTWLFTCTAATASIFFVLIIVGLLSYPSIVSPGIDACCHSGLCLLLLVKNLLFV